MRRCRLSIGIVIDETSYEAYGLRCSTPTAEGPVSEEALHNRLGSGQDIRLRERCGADRRGAPQ